MNCGVIIVSEAGSHSACNGKAIAMILQRIPVCPEHANRYIRPQDKPKE